jgi:hypothetical protein
MPRISNNRPGLTEAQRAGVRKTVIGILIFIVAVFSWTIIGKLIN